MLRSSDCFAALAGALVKAQVDLFTSEKLESATIRPGKTGDRTLSHGPSESGLDVVRRALGNYELAAIQTTTIDSASGTVNLTTTLAHSSGEWIASDWPVCPTTAAVNPRRMGAALTYARQCALFALVGISPKNNLDAQYLDAPDLPLGAGANPPPTLASDSTVASLLGHPTGCTIKGNNRQSSLPSPLPPQDSARLREGMLAEIQTLEASGAATWMQSMLAAKCRLALECTRRVETAFVARFPEFTNLESHDWDEPSSLAGQPHVRGAGHSPSDFGDNAQGLVVITKTVRHRSAEHLRLVRTQPCLICARQPSDAHHLRFAQPQALGRKVSDEFVVPLCRVHHREVHRSGSEIQWWRDRKLTPLSIAAELWRRTQSDERGDSGPP